MVRDGRLIYQRAFPGVRVSDSYSLGLGGTGAAGRSHATGDDVLAGQRILCVQPGGQLGIYQMGGKNTVLALLYVHQTVLTVYGVVVRKYFDLCLLF